MHYLCVTLQAKGVTVPYVNGQWVPPIIDGEVLRYYRTERLRMTEREMGELVFADRGDRGAQAAQHRLETGGSVKLSEDEWERLIELVTRVGSERDLYEPMCWVIQRDPTEGVRPVAGYLITAGSDEFVRHFLDKAKERGHLPRHATAVRLPQNYVERELAVRLASRTTLRASPDFDLVAALWLARVESYLRGDIATPEEVLEVGSGRALTHWAFWPSSLMYAQIGRIEALSSKDAVKMLSGSDGLPPDTLTPADFRRAQRLIALVEADTQRAREMFGDTIVSAGFGPGGPFAAQDAELVEWRKMLEDHKPDRPDDAS